MSLRFSIDDALHRGWITPEQAATQKASGQRRGLAPNPQSAKEKRPNTGPREARETSPTPERMVCSLEGDLPQEKLWRACVLHWPGWVRNGRLVWEYPGAVPGRRFRLDIAFPHHKLACEVDGWEHHGKYLSDFKRDRSRDRCLVLQGWRVLRFYAEEIHADSDNLVTEIEKALANTVFSSK